MEPLDDKIAGDELQEIGVEEHGGQRGVALVKKNLFDLEAAGIPTVQLHNSRQSPSWSTIMKLAFQCIGVVYGDLGTPPLYLLPGIFPNGISHQDDLLGVLSLIVYSLILITLIKYVFVVLAANDNGDGGTFALYSLICRHAKINLIPNHQVEDHQVSNYTLDVPNRRLKMDAFVKSILEKSKFMKCSLLFVTMLGVSMVIGDGILTPCISGG